MAFARIAVAVLAAVAAFWLGGCGRVVSGTATTASAPPPWDPCSLSDNVLRQAGLDPATRGTGSLGPGMPGWKSCGWRDADRNGVILSASSTATEKQVREGPGNIDFRSVAVDGRPAFTHRTEGDSRQTFCYLIMPFQGGGLMSMQVDRSPYPKVTTEMCGWAVRVADVLVAEIPR